MINMIVLNILIQFKLFMITWTSTNFHRTSFIKSISPDNRYFIAQTEQGQHTQQAGIKSCHIYAFNNITLVRFHLKTIVKWHVFTPCDLPTGSGLEYFLNLQFLSFNTHLNIHLIWKCIHLAGVHLNHPQRSADNVLLTQRICLNDMRHSLLHPLMINYSMFILKMLVKIGHKCQKHYSLKLISAFFIVLLCPRILHLHLTASKCHVDSACMTSFNSKGKHTAVVNPQSKPIIKLIKVACKAVNKPQQSAEN